jgi:hypothetical protein
MTRWVNSALDCSTFNAQLERLRLLGGYCGADHLNRICAATALGIGPAVATSFNSCMNVDVIGSFDDVNIHESDYGINVAGTFRIADELDESRQPMFNLSSIDCEKQTDENGKSSLGCKLTTASVYATDAKPNTDAPNCSLDISTSSYTMKGFSAALWRSG